MNKKLIIIAIVVIGIGILSVLLTMSSSPVNQESLVQPTQTVSQPANNVQSNSKRDPELVKEVEDFQKQNHPDVFLTNKVPYTTAQFSVASDFVKANPTGHYHFTVRLIGNKTSAKNSFTSWLQSLGLTTQQISTLDITYK